MKLKKVLPIIIAALVFSACVPVQSNAPVSYEAPRVVSVNGEGTVILTPDMATITIGVDTENKNAQIAVSQNSKQVAKIMKVFVDMGIEEEDIKTVNFSVYPRKKYDDKGNPISINYIVSNSVKVTVRDLDILGKLLDQVMDAGANNINGISFDVSDRESAYQEAMQVAMENAQQRAEVLVLAAGAKLGDVQSISSFISGGGGEVYAMERSFAMADDSSVPISSGGLSIQVQVSVVFEIK